MKYILLLIVLLTAPALAAYAPEEMCVIPWGDSVNQLKIALPFHEDIYNTPSDSTDDWIELGGGPNIGVVDKNENVYFASYDFQQLKSFNVSGELKYDISMDSPSFTPNLYQSWISNMYVDSLERLYVVGGSRQDYVALIDNRGNLIEKLSPYGENSGIIIDNIFPNSEDAFSFICRNGTRYTYKNNEFSEGGAIGWKAIDEKYYYATVVRQDSIKFLKYQNSDLNGVISGLQTIIKPYTNTVSDKSHFLGVDENLDIYLYQKGTSPLVCKVIIYDNSFNYKETIDFKAKENKYMRYMIPYMRPSDGNIYEFRCLDDGLHVIRWSKK
jgi:hypothetical protein